MRGSFWPEDEAWLRHHPSRRALFADVLMGSALLYGEFFAAAEERVKKIIGKCKKKEGIDYEEVADF